MANKMIPDDLYLLLFQWSYMNQGSDEEIKEKLKKYFEKKVQAEKLRTIYTKSKTATTQEEREENRQRYLDEKGIRQSFRW